MPLTPRTGMYVLQGVVPSAIAAAPFDVKIVDIYNDSGALHTPAEVALMGGGPGKALLLGYFSIGEAEVYRDYFSTIPSSALGPENPQWAGNYEVAFWTQAWRNVATAYIDRVIAAGYDGVMFDVVDEYQQAWAVANAPGGAAGAAQAMADLVAYLADYAHARVPTFRIWANNAEELLSNNTYFSHLDGMIKENLYYSDTGAPQSLSETQWSLDLMSRMLIAGKDVIAIEYVSTAAKIADVQARAAHDGVGYYTADINLDGISLTGVLPGQYIHEDWSGSGSTPPPPPPPVDLVLKGDAYANSLTGQSGNDTLYGYGGKDILKGNDGNDWLSGGRGNDMLTGGAGADVFTFLESGSKQADKITDFVHGQDRIALEDAVFTAIGPTGALATAAFWAGSAAHDADDRIIYNASTGAVFYDADGAGGASQVLVATLQLGAVLTATDFLIY
jgi:cysteinyl-tRNA synthetase, unknown class